MRATTFNTYSNFTQYNNTNNQKNLQKETDSAKKAQEAVKEKENSENIANDETKERKTYDSPLVKSMSDEQYESFERVIDGMDKSEIEQSIKGLEMINMTYIKAQQILAGNFSYLTNAGGDINSILASSKNLRELPNVLNHGLETLSGLNGNENPTNRDLLGFLKQFSNSLNSDSKGLNLRV